jgi:hypothetical protein
VNVARQLTAICIAVCPARSRILGAHPQRTARALLRDLCRCFERVFGGAGAGWRVPCPRCRQALPVTKSLISPRISALVSYETARFSFSSANSEAFHDARLALHARAFLVCSARCVTRHRRRSRQGPPLPQGSPQPCRLSAFRPIRFHRNELAAAQLIKPYSLGNQALTILRHKSRIGKSPRNLPVRSRPRLSLSVLSCRSTVLTGGTGPEKGAENCSARGRSRLGVLRGFCDLRPAGPARSNLRQ